MSSQVLIGIEIEGNGTATMLEGKKCISFKLQNGCVVLLGRDGLERVMMGLPSHSSRPELLLLPNREIYSLVC